MRILHVADLHLQEDWFDWVTAQAPRYDLLVIAGDLQNAFSNISRADQTHRLTKWLLALTTPTAVCSGNHDYWTARLLVRDLDAEARWLRRLAGQGKIVTDGQSAEISGARVAVNGWLQFSDLPQGADIVVTHAPPAGCSCAGSKFHDNGDSELWETLRWSPPRLLLCGHVHAPDSLWCDGLRLVPIR